MEIIDFYPGDSIVLPEGGIVKAFVNEYSYHSIKSVTNDFYYIYKNINERISYKIINADESILDEWIEDFLNEFSQFYARRSEGSDAHYSNLIGKTFSIEVELSEGEK